MKIALTVAFGTLWMWLAGCGHVGPNLARVDALKKVAIIGLSGTMDLHDENSSGQISGGLASLQGIGDVNSPEVQERRQHEGEAVYDALAAKLKAQLNWDVLPRDGVTANPVMQQLFVERMGQRRVNAGYRFGVPNVLWSEVADLPAARQQELKSALGVDALVVARVQIVSGRTYGYGVNGNGSFEVYPKAILGFSAYDGGDGAAWHEPYTAGPPTQGKVMRVMGVVNPENEPNVVVEATELAADVLVQKLGAARQSAPTASAANPGS